MQKVQFLGFGPLLYLKLNTASELACLFMSKHTNETVNLLKCWNRSTFKYCIRNCMPIYVQLTHETVNLLKCWNISTEGGINMQS